MKVLLLRGSIRSIYRSINHRREKPMARKPARKRARKTSPKTTEPFDEKALTKGQLRKLNALRKSVGEEIGTAAFAKWLAAQPTEPKIPTDKNAEQIAAALDPLVKTKKLRIPRGGYLVKRGRGRVVVTRPEAD